MPTTGTFLANLGGLALKHPAWAQGWKRCTPSGSDMVKGDVGGGEEERMWEPEEPSSGPFYVTTSLHLERPRCTPSVTGWIQQDFRREELCESLPEVLLQAARPPGLGILPGEWHLPVPWCKPSPRKTFPFFPLAAFAVLELRQLSSLSLLKRMREKQGLDHGERKMWTPGHQCSVGFAGHFFEGSYSSSLLLTLIFWK